MDTSKAKYSVFALIFILFAGGGIAYAYKIGWKNGYIIAKNGEFRQLSICAVQDFHTLKIADNPIEIRNAMRVSLKTKLEQMSFVDGYISMIEDKGLAFGDIKTLSELEFQGKKINSRQARVEEINRLRTSQIKSGTAQK